MNKAVVIAGVLAAGITCAPLAQANNQDQMFIAFLDSHGVSARLPDMNNAVQSGHMACQDLAAGKSMVDVELDVSEANPPGISRADASWVVAAAKKAFCP